VSDRTRGNRFMYANERKLVLVDLALALIVITLFQLAPVTGL